MNSPAKLCETCIRKCKQPAHLMIISCPNYEAAPKQLVLPFKF